MNYYRRFPGDYLRDTRRLNLLQHGAYTLLLDELYSTEQHIPSEEDALRICQATTEEEKGAVIVVLERFFRQTRHGFTNDRFEEELSYTNSRSKRLSDAAKERWKKQCISNAQAMPMHCKSNATPDSRLQTPEEEREEKDKPVSAGADVSAPSRILFEIFCQERGSLPGVRELNAQRLSKCHTRLTNHKTLQGKYLADFREAVRKAGVKQWPNWRPSFDWFIENDKNYLKVLEGNYDQWGVEGASNGRNKGRHAAALGVYADRETDLSAGTIRIEN